MINCCHLRPIVFFSNNKYNFKASTDIDNQTTLCSFIKRPYNLFSLFYSISLLCINNQNAKLCRYHILSKYMGVLNSCLSFVISIIDTPDLLSGNFLFSTVSFIIVSPRCHQFLICFRWPILYGVVVFFILFESKSKSYCSTTIHKL